MASQDYLIKETELLRKEIQDTNAKVIDVGKIYGALMLGYFAYLMAPIMWFISNVKDNSFDVSNLTSKPSYPERSLILGAKVYSLVGIFLTFLITITLMYMLSQWARSKRHRIRLWRQMDAIRSFSLQIDPIGADFRDNYNLLPIDSSRPKVSSNVRNFGVIAHFIAFLLFLLSTGYFTIAWHLQAFYQKGFGLDFTTSREALNQFLQLFSPSIGFVALASLLSIRNGRDFYEQLNRADAISHRTPYPEDPKSRLRSFLSHWALKVIFPFSIIACLILGALAVPWNERGSTLGIIALERKWDISPWWTYATWLGISLFYLVLNWLAARRHARAHRRRVH